MVLLFAGEGKVLAVVVLGFLKIPLFVRLAAVFLVSALFEALVVLVALLLLGVLALLVTVPLPAFGDPVSESTPFPNFSVL